MPYVEPVEDPDDRGHRNWYPLRRRRRVGASCDYYRVIPRSSLRLMGINGRNAKH